MNRPELLHDALSPLRCMREMKSKSIGLWAAYQQSPTPTDVRIHCVDWTKGSRKMTSDNFIPKCMKYSVFFLVLLYWILGACSTVAGMTLYFYQLLPIQEFISVQFNPAFVLSVIGMVLFMTAIIGFLGALRENINFLRLFLVILFFLLIACIATAIVAFVMLSHPPTVGVHTEDRLRKAVISYKDDEKSAEYIDKIQTSIQCCGIGYEGYMDWMLNPYFSCTENSFSIERCGVPASCCRFDSKQLETVDLTCGYGVISKATISKLKVSPIINTQGCVSKVEDIMQKSVELMFFYAFGIALTLICGIVLSARTVKLLESKVRDYWKNYNMKNNMMHYIPHSSIYNIACPVNMQNGTQFEN